MIVGFLLAAPSAVAQGPHAPTSIEPLARVPHPGAPKDVTLGPDGLIYTASLNLRNGDPRAPSAIFAFTHGGELEHKYLIEGQRLDEDHGLTRPIFDAQGRLYVVDQQGPVVHRLDLRAIREGRAGQTVYATISDLPPCNRSNGPECSPGSRDLPPLPDYPVFTADGTMYITDSLQGVIWRVPPGGGQARVWFGDVLLQPDVGEPAYGPSGARLSADGRSLVFTSCVQRFGSTPRIISGFILEIPIEPDGTAGPMEVFYESDSAGCPADVEIAASGIRYTTLVGDLTNPQVAALSPAGEELWRAPRNGIENLLLEIPLDAPTGLALDDLGRLIVSNTSFFRHDPSSWALIAFDVGDRPLQPVLPSFRNGSQHAQRRAPATRQARVRQRATNRGARRCRASTRSSRRTTRRSSGPRETRGRADGRCRGQRRAKRR